MDAFLLHLDEELINTRKGRRYGLYSLLEQGRYTPRELAFWINFYALFYDRLFMPPNFLTDNRLTLEVLAQLGANDRNSLIRSSMSPVRIYWEDRWPPTFEALVQEDWTSSESVTNQPSKDLALEIARVCENIFSSRIYYGTVDTRVDRMHSLKRMREYVFSDLNAAQLHTPLHTLRECVEQIEARPLEMGYGRNLLYAMFGFFRADAPASQRALCNQFADIFEPYLKEHTYFTHEFLMGLDYVSHELKAKRASELLGSDLKLLMPPDYYDGFRRARYESLPTEFGVRQSDCVFIDIDAIIALSPKQLEDIRHLPERMDFLAALDQLRDSPNSEDVKNSEDAFRAYLHGIGHILHPIASRVSESALAIRPGCRYIGPSIGFLFLLCGVPPIAGVLVGVTLGHGLEKGLAAVAERTRPSASVPVSQIVLTEEVKVNVQRH